MRSADSRELRERADQGVSSVQDAGRVPRDTGPAVSKVSRDWGGVVRETAGERHDRHVDAIEAVLRRYLGPAPEVRRIAEQCLDAAEVGF